jgi:diguanylate cyclase (GGDEF)-like protein/PAS domain S-box-containing protein
MGIGEDTLSSQVVNDNDQVFRTLVDKLSEGVYLTDKDRRIEYWNEGAERISGYSAEDVQGCCCSDNLLMHVDCDGRSLCKGACPLAASMNDGVTRTDKVFLHHKEGHRVPVMVTTAPILNDEGWIIGGIETFHDVTTEMSALAQVEELKSQSLVCPLTSVGNRRYTTQVLAAKFDEMNRNNATTGLVFLDIDHFKSINDRYGHQVGDVTLKMVAQTLSNAMRSYDFVGRWGGEEFLVILPNTNRLQLRTISERLRALVEKSSTTISKGKLVVTISVGATVATPSDKVEMAVARADALMYESKKNGRNRVRIG